MTHNRIVEAVVDIAKTMNDGEVINSTGNRMADALESIADGLGGQIDNHTGNRVADALEVIADNVEAVGRSKAITFQFDTMDDLLSSYDEFAEKLGTSDLEYLVYISMTVNDMLFWFPAELHLNKTLNVGAGDDKLGSFELHGGNINVNTTRGECGVMYLSIPEAGSDYSEVITLMSENSDLTSSVTLTNVSEIIINYSTDINLTVFKLGA